MLRFRIARGRSGCPAGHAARGGYPRFGRVVRLVLGALLVSCTPARADILWSDLGETTARETGAGGDILGGVLKRDNTASDTLYFKFHVNPLSDFSTEPYSAGFQFFEGNQERLGLGNSWEAWAYSAYNTAEKGESNSVAGDYDLHSSRPDASALQTFWPYERVRRGVEGTIVFKVHYRPGTNDLVTVWLNPDLSPGATEARQPESLTTRFEANAAFDQIHLRHHGGGDGWVFSDMAVATSFDDFVASRTTSGLTFQAWTTEQGLPQNSVRALTQTREGYLWVGTDEGLARFDGIRFVRFEKREGLRSGPVRTLFEDSQGALWIGTTAGGLSRIDHGQVTSYTMQNGLPADAVVSLAEDTDGRVWIGTEAGLTIWDKGQLSRSAATEFKGKSVTALFRDRTGMMWVGVAGAGVFKFFNRRFVPLPDPSPDHLLQDPHCLLVDRAGRIWIGAGDDTVLCRDGERWDRHDIRRRLARPMVSSLVETPDGSVWAGTMSEGLFEFKSGRIASIDARSGLLDNLVESLLVDREGNLWVGTGAGLNRLRRSNLTVMEVNQGLGYGAVQGLAEIKPGLIWAGKPSDGLYCWRDNAFSRISPAGLARRYLQISSLLKARDGSCWVAGAHGLLRFKDPQEAGDEPLLSLPGLNIVSLCQDPQGDLWAGTHEGMLYRSHFGVWNAQTNFTQTHAITAIVPGKNGTLWIGTEGGGVYRLDGAVQLHLDARNGLLSDLIRTLYLDKQDTLWIGTAGGGLSRWRNERLTDFTTSEGLPDNTISQILEDDEGRLWLGSNRGIACVSRRELDDWVSGQILYPRVYGRTEGMLSEECTGGFCPAGLRASSGLLWFSTLKGVVVVDPRPRIIKAPAPTVLLEEVLVDNAPLPDAEVAACTTTGSANLENEGGAGPPVLRIGPGAHKIEFRYTGLNFSAPEKVRFRYRLDNLDAKWEDAENGTVRTATYPLVPPGRYRFQVIACNSDGVWNEEGAGIRLEVTSYFWQTWWFIGLAGLFLLAAVGGTGRLVEIRRFRRRLKLLEQERALEHERARIAQDLHDDLGSSLARLSLLSGLVKADKDNPALVETHAAKISQSADQTVRALEEIVWAVRPGSDSLQSLADYIAHFANELFEGNRTRCRLDLPHDLPAQPLPPDVRHNIFLIVKEALTNALKHAGAGEVRVQAKVSNHTLEILIQDDGKGFDAAGFDARNARNGLGNMSHRAQAIGGTLACESAPGQGTSVRLTVRFNGDARVQG
jgi:ligand-binding sensor domain-containing protein/signal transduction histidine kinase